MILVKTLWKMSDFATILKVIFILLKHLFYKFLTKVMG